MFGNRNDCSRCSLANIIGPTGQGSGAVRAGFCNPLLVDATIQRFEFTIELFWKTFRHLLALEDKETFSPKESLQAAYQLGWIHDEAAWLGMLTDRNLTSHTYHEALAAMIFANIRANFPEMERTYQFLQKRFPQTD